uniref:Uncharacterized protein n=1 Tax=Brachymyrmex patagonicus TaxID=604570 RepID=F1AG53_9HYME|nr:hypothetical protein [Brachymyrmex patagonicus]
MNAISERATRNDKMRRRFFESGFCTRRNIIYRKARKKKLPLSYKFRL